MSIVSKQKLKTNKQEPVLCRMVSVVASKSASVFSTVNTKELRVVDDANNVNDMFWLIKTMLNLWRCDGDYSDLRPMQSYVRELLLGIKQIEYPTEELGEQHEGIDAFIASVLYGSVWCQSATGSGKTVVILALLLLPYREIYTRLEAAGILKKVMTEGSTEAARFQVEHFKDSDGVPLETTIFHAFDTPTHERLHECFDLNITESTFNQIKAEVRRTCGTLPQTLQEWQGQESIDFIEKHLIYGWLKYNDHYVDLTHVLETCLHVDLHLCHASWTTIV